MYGSITIDPDQTIVSIVGNQISKTENVLAKVFSSISEIPVRMVSYGGSRHNISILVSREHKEQTLRLLNKGLFD
jgi:aspartate kinase